jgi:RHS repeat-associated protein
MRPTKWDVSNVQGYNYHYADYNNERTRRVTFAENLADHTLDRSYEYDLVGRLAISHSGAEATAHVINGQWGTQDGPYAQGYDYDVWGNVTHKYGWGGEVQGGGAGQSSDIYYSYTGNRRNGFGYDAAGNVTNDGTQTFLYDATGQQTYASGAGGSAPTFTDDPLNPPNAAKTEIKLVHLTELRAAVNQLRARAALAAATWTTDPNPQQYVTSVHHNHIQQLRTKLEEALNTLHLPIGSYAHSGPNAGDTIYAADFQELREKIKTAWTALAASFLTQTYDGNGLRVKKTEYGAATWYLRSSVLGGQVIAEVDGSGAWQRGYVYAGGTLMAVQQSSSVYWIHEDPVTKSKRTTDAGGAIVSAIEPDPWGADTNRSGNSAFQPKKFTSYERDGNGSDEAMFRRYNRKHSRFDQPDPYDGSYSLTDPQSFNRYAYTQNDPVNFTDPTGLDPGDPIVRIYHEEPGMRKSGGRSGGLPTRRVGYVVEPRDPIEPQDTRQPKKEPCPPVPDHPADADIDKNIESAASARKRSWTPVGPSNWFYNQVKNGGYWDYKQQGKRDGKNYENFGNFNFGATGAALQIFSDRELLREAGRAQVAAGTSRPQWGYPGSRLSPYGGKAPFGDDPNDQNWIKKGIAYYRAKRRGCQ